MDEFQILSIVSTRNICDSVFYSSYLNKLLTKNRYRAINPFIT